MTEIKELLKSAPRGEASDITYREHYVVPRLPDVAYKIITDYERQARMPVLIIAYDVQLPNVCQNCNGLGVVYARLCGSGPFVAPGFAGAVVTYVIGDERWRGGWYVVKDTMAWKCPECQKG